ncbi:hypothetical protein C1Y02_30620, partial [Pseudomonas sp. FW306-02-F04-AA]
DNSDVVAAARPLAQPPPSRRRKEADMAKTALFRWTILATAALALSACAVGPNYKRPAAPMQASYREAEGWTPATPLDHIDRGAWWSA